MPGNNNALNNISGASNSGSTNSFTITNPSNTASSAARTIITVGGVSAADPTLNFNVSGATDWEMGIDNNDSDKWKLSQGTALGTNDSIVAFTTGEILKPLQPAFSAFLTATDTNVTGDGTIYPLSGFTEYFDINSDFNAATGTFTAPVAGIYWFNLNLRGRDFGAAHTTWTLRLHASVAGIRQLFNVDPRSVFNTVTNELTSSTPHIFSLAAGETVIVEVESAGGPKTVDVEGGAGSTIFQGYLLG